MEGNSAFSNPVIPLSDSCRDTLITGVLPFLTSLSIGYNDVGYSLTMLGSEFGPWTKSQLLKNW